MADVNLEIQSHPLDSLFPHARNARTHSAAQVAQIVASVREFGWTNPVLIDGDGGIIAGHGRVLAARELGMDTVPCIELAHLSEAQKRAYVIADNKLALNAGWDDELLRLEIGELSDLGYDIALTGFSDVELSALLLPANAGLTQEDETPEPPAVPVTQLGDLWVLGPHRVKCGDSHGDDLARLLAGATPDVTIVDPPFEERERFKRFIVDPCIVFGQGRHLLAIPPKLWRFERVIDKVTGHRGASIQVRHRHAFIVQCGTVKTCPQDGQLTLDSIVQCAERPDHPHQKPVSLVVEHLTHYTPPGPVVLDPYGGSGTTVIACEQVGRSAYVMELAPVNVDVIVKRWEQYTGGQATRADRAAQAAA